MPEYLAPGVYTEEISTGPVPIEGVSTSTAGFVGLTERGPTTVRLVTSLRDFQRWYGGPVEPRRHGLLPAVRGQGLLRQRRPAAVRRPGDRARTPSRRACTLRPPTATPCVLEAIGPGQPRRPPVRARPARHPAAPADQLASSSRPRTRPGSGCRCSTTRRPRRIPLVDPFDRRRAAQPRPPGAGRVRGLGQPHRATRSPATTWSPPSRARSSSPSAPDSHSRPARGCRLDAAGRWRRR